MKRFTLLLSAMLLACATNLWADDSWVKVSIDQLTSSDVFIIVDSTSGYAIPNNPEKQPLAVSIMKDGAWDFTNIADNLKWNITGNNTEGYVISPNGDATKRLYCQNDNNGVRVGTPTGTAYNLFWDATVNKLKQQVPDKNNKTITRWIGCYNKTDWRCYNSGTANNIKGTVTRFYKLVTVANTVSVAVADGQEEMGSVAMSYKTNSTATEWTVATEPVEIAGEGEEEFQFVATPKDGYKFAGWTTTGDITLNDLTAATTEGGLATETSVVTANFERDATLQSLTISGTATKLNYFVGDTFDPAGLVVTATYSDGATDDVTDQVVWTFTPAELALATTAVSVVATWNEVSSAAYEVKDIVVTEPVRFEKWVGEVVEGEYLLVDAGETDAVAMSTTVSKDRLQYNKVVINAEGQIIEPSADVVWKIARDSAFWTIANGEKFAAGNGTKNQIQLLQAVGNQARWEISATETGHTIVNYGNQTAEVNATLRRNGTYGFACYAAETGAAPVLYKKVTDETFVTVTVSVNDAAMGSVYGGGRYAVGATATLTAVPAAGYKLIGWSNDNQITTTTQSFTVEEEITITANFAKGATAIESAAVETPAVKSIENGQLVILRDGVKYNAMGVRLQ